jgi:large subunit ribosomal protein L25
MTPDDVIRVADIPLPDGVTAAVDEDALVVTVLLMKVVEEEIAEEGEGEEGEEGEEGGDAAAEGDASGE